MHVWLVVFEIWLCPFSSPLSFTVDECRNASFLFLFCPVTIETKECHPVAPEYRPRSQLNWLSKGGPFPRPASSPGAKRARPHFKLDRAPHPVGFKTRPSRPVRFETAPVASGAGRCGHRQISNSRTVWFETGPRADNGPHQDLRPARRGRGPKFPNPRCIRNGAGDEIVDTGGQKFGRVHKNAKTRYCDLAFHSSERFE